MNSVLKLLVWSSFFLTFAVGLLGPIYAVFVEEIGGDLITAGAAYGAFAISCGAIILLLSFVENKNKHKENFIIMGRLLAVIAIAGYIFVKSPIDLLIVQMLLGISYAIVAPAYDALYSRNLCAKNAAKDWGVWESQVVFAEGISAIIGGVIAQLFGFKTLFFLMLIVSIFAFLAAFFLRRHKMRE